MDFRKYFDATFLKTAKQSKMSKEEHLAFVENFILECIENEFKLVMVKPKFVSLAKNLISAKRSKLLVGTVISFPDGNSSIEKKKSEALKAIKNGADELDFVINYEAFKNGEIKLVEEEVLELSKFCLDHKKICKWIIEIAALQNHQIAEICSLIKKVIIKNFTESDFEKVFVKSSTGFFRTYDGKPNGATIEGIKIMLENSFPLPVKASGGVKNMNDVIAYIKLGVKRIGTSSAQELLQNIQVNNSY